MNLRVKDKRSSKTLIIFDEFADAYANSRRKSERNEGEKSLEENLRLLLQKGRSAGFRIVAATQRASTKIINGDSKVNFPVQICFRVPKEADSRVVLDEGGAECLAGAGDGLIKSPEYMDTIRFQAYYKPETVTA
jgi:DNA segregation ATPase FtsK/SpoIIIE-like protein